MPKQFLETDKKKWLELYEKGKTEIWIAREHAKCDPRTVKRGIEEARRKQDARVARAELLKDALRKHQDSLLEGLDHILSSLRVPEKDFVVLSWHHNGDSIFSQSETTMKPQTDEVPESSRASGRRGKTGPGLLQQHLKNDRLWKVLAQWEKAYATHLDVRIALQRKTVAVIEGKTGYKLVDRNDVPPPFLYSYTAGDVFLKTILRKAFGTLKDIDLEKAIIANTDAGDVRYYGSVLAEAPGSEEKTRVNLLAAFQELTALPEVIAVVDTYKALNEITMRARQVVQQIKLLGLIPGQCEICRRLGM